MGMDVYGKNPRSEEGKYFRNNVWAWRPLADYACEVAPQITSACKYWQSNDGHGLDDAGAIALADVLQAEVDSGQCLLFAKRWTSAQELTPKEPCKYCDASGTRKAPPKLGAGDLKTGGVKCNACDGTGYIDPFSTHYPFYVENVVEFIGFLRDCGGFEIC
jgi:hypothetical protein